MIRSRCGLAAMITVITAVGVSACGSSSTKSSTAGAGSSPTPLTLQLRFTPTVQFAGDYAAQSLGYFKTEGLDVKILPSTGTVGAETLLMEGKINIGESAPETTAEAIEHGAKVTIIAAGFQKTASAIISLEKDPIRTPQELVGKRVGVIAANTSIPPFLSANGVKPSAVTIVPTQGTPSSLLSGQVNAMFGLTTNEALEIKADGYTPVVMTYAAHHLNSLDMTYTVANSSLTNPSMRNAIVRFLMAEIKGWEKITKDPTYATNIVMNTYGKGLGLQRSQQLAEAKAQIPLIQPTANTQILSMSHAAIQTTIATLAREGVKASPSMFNTSLLAEAYKRLAEQS